MSHYYTEQRAAHYDRRWRTFTKTTLAQVQAIIDEAALRHIPLQQGRPPRVLDVACGTGLLLEQFLTRLPDAEVFGVDASTAMLAQARIRLQGESRVHLDHGQLGPGETANLPYGPAMFDLITCTNALHNIPDPAAMLGGLRSLLAPTGQLVVEDFARRAPPFPWPAFEWLLRWIEGSHVHAFSLAEAQELCHRGGLHVACRQAFTIDWLWHGWVVRTDTASSRTPSTNV